MKKLLALVLALVMTLGLATVSSSAAYSDEADVSLNEAVDVMSAVGVFQGADGKFSPKANLNREQAAKLIAYLDLGENAAEALPAVKVFSDVPATSWSAKYIAYCQDAGYIVGDGTGKFNPAGELSGYAFGKMVLCVLGYDADIEGFTGNNWSINVAKLMEKNDIADGVSGAASATLTREQAAQYCLNALKANVVEYDTKGTSVEINGAKIATGASSAKAVAIANENGKNYAGAAAGADGLGYQQLCEKLYGTDLKLTSSTTNGFKAPAVKWTYKNSEVDTYADAPTATYTGKVTKGTIYTLLGKDVADDLAHKNTATTPAYDRAALKAYVDGVETTDYAQETQVVKNSSAAAFGTDRGTITEVYVDDDGQDRTVGEGTAAVTSYYAKVTVIVKNTYLMKATADYNTKTEKLAVSYITKPANLPASLSVDDYAVEGFKKDDYILFTAAKEATASTRWKIESIEKAPVVSGKVDSYASDSVTLDGTKYNWSSKTLVYSDAQNADNSAYNAHGKGVSYTIGDTATVVLDGQNNIIYVDEAKASNDDVIFVKSVAKNGFDYIAKVVTVDGKKMTVTLDDDSYSAITNNKKVKISDDNLAKTVNGEPTPGTFDGKFWAYEVNGSEYELSPYSKAGTVSAGSSATTITLNKRTSFDGKDYSTTPATISTKVANSDTVYIVEDKDGDIKLYTGVKNAPKTVTVGTNGTANFVYKDNNVVYVYVKASGDIESADSSNDQMIYIVKPAGSTVYTDSAKNKYVEAKALVDGVETTLKIKKGSTAQTALTVTSSNPVRGKLYTKMTVDSDGYITAMTAATASASGALTKYEKLTITDNADAFSYDGETVAVTYDPTSSSSSNSIESGFVKTDSVYVVLFKTPTSSTDSTNKNAALMDDDDADYEIVEVRDFEALEGFVKGYTITGNVWVLLDDDTTDAEIIGAYVGITESKETPASGT